MIPIMRMYAFRSWRSKFCQGKEKTNKEAKTYDCSEEEFFSVVGYNRSLVPMHYDKGNINRQNFFLGGTMIAYRER